MASLLRFLALCLLLNLTLPAVAGNSIGKDELDAQKELLLLKIDSGKELAQKDIEILNKRFEAVDKRIDDQANRVSDIGNSVDRFAVICGIFGILITVILTAAGLFGFLFAASRAKETASTVATETASRIAEHKAAELAAKWIDDHNTQLHKEIEDVRKTSQHAQREIDELQNTARQGKQEVHDSVNDFKTVARTAKESLQTEISTVSPDTTKQSSQQNDSSAQALNKLAESLQSNPDSEHDFEAWDARAFAAYASKDYRESARCWQHAAQTPNANRIQAATSLFNAAASLAEQQLHDQAISVYDHIIAEYSPAIAPALRKQVARAMHSKGVSFGKLQRNEEAIAVYDELIDRYINDPTPALQQQVARAMYNKGVRIGIVRSSEEEIATYNEVITRYIGDTDPTLTNVVALAMNGKGFNHLIEAKRCWTTPAQAKKLLEIARDDLQAAFAKKPHFGMVLGNLAYVEWLLNQENEAKLHFYEGLEAIEGGGEELYKLTLDDIAQHPIPEDTGFKEMVERLWDEWHSKHQSENQ